jgi:uncharacterized DUF497 family protein
MDVVWDPRKAAQNRRKHGIRISDAATVLGDPGVLTREDADADLGPRFVPLGRDALGRVLVVVVWTERSGNVGLISARQASPGEAKHCAG